MDSVCRNGCNPENSRSNNAYDSWESKAHLRLYQKRLFVGMQIYSKPFLRQESFTCHLGQNEEMREKVYYVPHIQKWKKPFALSLYWCRNCSENSNSATLAECWERKAYFLTDNLVIIRIDPVRGNEKYSSLYHIPGSSTNNTVGLN